jgi:hypothetical protein
VQRGELADGPQHVRLGGHIEAGRGLVQHDQSRAAREGDRQAHTLLLATRKLVRVAPQVRRIVRERNLAHHLGHPFAPLVTAAAVVVSVEDLAQLGADAQGRVQGRRRILRYVRDETAAEVLELGRVQLEDVHVPQAHGPAGDLHAASCVAEQRESDERLDGARLAHDAHDLLAQELARDAVDGERPICPRRHCTVELFDP